MEGIIYKVQPYLEHSRLLFVYTEQGKKTLLAQGAQKVNQASRILSQYLTKIHFQDTHKSFSKLIEGSILNDYAHIKTDFYQTKYAALMFEIIDHIVTDDLNHHVIYLDISHALDSRKIDIAALSFAVKILRPLGFGIDLKPSGKKILGVSIEKGGLTYEKESYKVDLEIKEATQLLKLSQLSYESLDQQEDFNLPLLKIFILNYYQYHLQTTLKNLQ
jgi:DNA repair protein RecO (recombination protein O)